ISAIQKIADEGHSAWESFKNEFSTNAWMRLGAPAPPIDNSGYAQTQRAIEQNNTLLDVLNQQKLDVDDLGKVVAEGGDAYNQFINALNSAGDSGQRVAQIFQDTRSDIVSMLDAARNSTPGLGSLTEAVETLSSSSAEADDRVSALKKALDALSGKPVELEDAMQSYNDAIRDVIGSTSDKWDTSKGFGAELIDAATGGVNTLTENGSKLRDVLKELRDETAQVAASGGDMGPVFERNAQVLRDLGSAVGLTEEQIVQLAESVGYMPDQITTLVNLRGASDVTQKLTVMRALMDANREGVTIDTKLTGSAEVIAQLQAAGAKVTEVTGKPGVFSVEAPDIPNVIAEIDKLIAKQIPDKVVRVRVQNEVGNEAFLQIPEAARPRPLPARAGGGTIPGFATGGTIQGPGTGTSDNILGIDPTTGRPTAWVSPGEEVVKEKSARKWRGLLKMINRDAPELQQLQQLPMYAAGGSVPYGVQKAVEAARSVEGNKYVWGGTGPTNFDCSGFVGWLQQILMGIEGSTKRLYTTYSLLDGSTAGLEPGLGPSGTYFRVGVSQEHMAATLAGQPVESGGAHGTSGIGGSRAGATDSQFPFKFHLPNSLIKGYLEGGGGISGGTLIEWTAEDERELERLHIAVQKAKERRDEVYADAESSPSDRRLADLDVADAEDKVIEKQRQKDRQGQIDGGERIAPEAPELSRMYSEEEADRISKLAAVQAARERRNEVYDDPTSTAIDKAQADAEYSRAIQEAQAPDEDEKTPAQTVRDIFTNAASNAAGAAFDAFKEQLPDKVSGSHWWDVADQVVALANEDDDEDDARSVTGSTHFNPAEVLQQLGFIPGPDGEAPDWVKKARAKAPKVFDNGGWLEPGEMGINLSSRPEPIFSSPEQLRQFAGSTLDAPASQGISREEFERALLARPNVTVNTDRVSEGIRKVRSENSRAVRTYMRR
ncbi:NlpC/P60 family protein, partial [Nocardia farcinica]